MRKSLTNSSHKESILDESSLVEEIASGSQAALRQLYELYGGLVYSIAFRVIEDENEAEEISQDVFVKIWRIAPTYDANKCSLKGWVSLIARSSSLDRLRKKRRRPDQVVRNLVELNLGEAIDSKDEGHRDKIDTSDRMLENLATLRVEYRKSVELAYFKGYTQKEIGKALRVPEGTAKTYLRRGLMKLRELMGVTK